MMEHSDLRIYKKHLTESSRNTRTKQTLCLWRWRMSQDNVSVQRRRQEKQKKLKGSWRTKKPKTFGKARVARVQTENRYGHVVEEGHRVVTGGSTVDRNGRKLNVLQRGIRGISVGGKTKGEKMIEDTVKELNATFEKNAKKLLDDLTSEVEL